MGDLFSIIPVEAWAAVAVLNIVAVVVLFVMNLSNRIKIRKLKGKYDKFMSGVCDGNLEQILGECLEKVYEVKKKNKDIENHINSIERNLLQCVQKVSIVRFNAFDNVGSDLSFSIALLDSNDNGIILSSLYSRDNSSTYAKPIISGKSKHALSAEEIQALDIARKTSRERIYTG